MFCIDHEEQVHVLKKYIKLGMDAIYVEDVREKDSSFDFSLFPEDIDAML